MICKLKLKNSDKYALVDDKGYNAILENEFFKEFGFLTNLRLASTGYAVSGKMYRQNGIVKSFTIYLHKYIAEKFIPKPQSDKKLFVCFKNENRLDCRIENLEWKTALERNLDRKDVLSTAGYKGVTKVGENTFRASLSSNGKNYSLGCFKSAEEAALAYNKKSIELFGVTKRLNIINENKRPEINIDKENTLWYKLNNSGLNQEEYLKEKERIIEIAIKKLLKVKNYYQVSKEIGLDEFKLLQSWVKEYRKKSAIVPRSKNKYSIETEKLILKLRKQRKIGLELLSRVLADEYNIHLSFSTIYLILKKHNKNNSY